MKRATTWKLQGVFTKALLKTFLTIQNHTKIVIFCLFANFVDIYEKSKQVLFSFMISAWFLKHFIWAWLSLTSRHQPYQRQSQSLRGRRWLSATRPSLDRLPRPDLKHWFTNDYCQVRSARTLLLLSGGFGWGLHPGFTLELHQWNRWITFVMSHIVWKSPKMSHLIFSILALSTNFVLLKLTRLVTLFDRKLQVFKGLPKWTFFGIYY